MTPNSIHKLDNPVEQKHGFLIYDGECPFCSVYVRLTRIRENFDLQLIDARSTSQAVRDVVAAGYDLDEGFVLKLDDVYHHGQEALQVLALMSSKSGLFNQLTSWTFSNQARARLVYPFLRFGRNTTLRLLRRKRLSNITR